jgi:hypothetical protein
MARAPVGNAKTHSTPSHDEHGVEHKKLPSPPAADGDSDEESEGEESTAGEGVESRLQKELRW